MGSLQPLSSYRPPTLWSHPHIFCPHLEPTPATMYFTLSLCCRSPLVPVPLTMYNKTVKIKFVDWWHTHFQAGVRLRGGWESINQRKHEGNSIRTVSSWANEDNDVGNQQFIKRIPNIFWRSNRVHQHSTGYILAQTKIVIPLQNWAFPTVSRM